MLLVKAFGYIKIASNPHKKVFIEQMFKTVFEWGILFTDKFNAYCLSK